MRLTFGILNEFSDRLNLEILNSRCKRDWLSEFPVNLPRNWISRFYVQGIRWNDLRINRVESLRFFGFYVPLK